MLADTAHLVEGMSEADKLKMPYEFTNYEFTGTQFTTQFTCFTSMCEVYILTPEELLFLQAR